MIEDHIIQAVQAHADASAPYECCGFVVVFKGRQRYIKATNVAEDARNRFVISAEEYAQAEEQGEILAIAHSHVLTPPTPTQTDLVGIEETNLPWLIVNTPVGTHTVTTPSGYKAPLVGREFSHGVLDCYALLKDYYAEVLNITLPEYDREKGWEDRGENLIEKRVEDAGFIDIDESEVQEHDVILMQITEGMAKPVTNHISVYVGGGAILHHATGRLSSRDVYGGMWRSYTTRFLRHRERYENDTTTRGVG